MKIIKLLFAIIFAAIFLPLHCFAQTVEVLDNDNATMTVTLEPGDYSIIGNDTLRKALSEELLVPNTVFLEEVPKNLPNVAIPDPWLFPNNITSKDKAAPAMSFYNANLFILDTILCNGNIPEDKWAAADKIFQDSAESIAKLKPVSYIFLDGVDKKTGEHIAMPRRGYYNALITALLGAAAVNLADADGKIPAAVFSAEQTKEKVLIIVSHSDSQEDLEAKDSKGKKTDYQHVVVFEGNLPLPENISAFSAAAAAEVKNMTAKKDSKAADKTEKVGGLKRGLYSIIKGSKNADENKDAESANRKKQ